MITRLISKSIIKSYNNITLEYYLNDINIMYRTKHKTYGIIDMNQYIDFYDGTIVYNIYDFSSPKYLNNFINSQDFNIIHNKYSKILHSIKNTKLSQYSYCDDIFLL